MSEPADPQGTGRVEADWQRRRRLAEVFGDVLPEQTTDDADQPTPSADSASDAWLKRQVPPHHG